MTCNELNHAQKLTFEALESRGTLNTFQLRDLGFCSPSTMVFEMRAKGLTINTELKPAHDNTGRLHPRVAHYSLGKKDE
jgi:hypothetical protein